MCKGHHDMQSHIALKFLGTVYPKTLHNILEDLNLQQHYCENLKSHISQSFVILYSPPVTENALDVI